MVTRGLEGSPATPAASLPGEYWSPSEGGDETGGGYETASDGHSYYVPSFDEWSHSVYLKMYGDWPAGPSPALEMTAGDLMSAMATGNLPTGQRVKFTRAELAKLQDLGVKYPGLTKLGAEESWTGVFGAPGAGERFTPWERLATGGGGQPTTPPTPEWSWLPQVMPGIGKRLGTFGGQVKVPSGQLWGAVPWSQRQGLGSILEWYGGEKGSPSNLTDLLNYMQMMQPKTPATPRGWSPARQRA